MLLEMVANNTEILLETLYYITYIYYITLHTLHCLKVVCYSKALLLLPPKLFCLALKIFIF